MLIWSVYMGLALQAVIAGERQWRSVYIRPFLVHPSLGYWLAKVRARLRTASGVHRRLLHLGPLIAARGQSHRD